MTSTELHDKVTRMKLERIIGYTKELDGRYTWSVILFQPKTNFAFAHISPGFFDTFGNKKECSKNILETFKKMGMKIDLRKKEIKI